MIDVVLHMGLELCGQGVWACVRGRCKHRHHRYAGDAVILFVIACLTVRWLG